MNLAWPHLRQVLSFVLVGASSTGLYFLLLWALSGRIDSVLLLTACCYAISMIYNYVLQSWLTFRAGPPTRRSLSRFGAMHLGAMALNSLLMAGLVEGLGTALFASQIVVTGLISALIFVVSKHWVYRG
ncbi:GtrA family protein [Paracoccus sp. (in: a-proteobacteria)]|uniref:GtrA family protein n=1 Tax=Paracoccus sp. TaxID=267 RepID=UPI00321FB0F9